MGYNASDSIVRMSLFKPSGKWYECIAVDMNKYYDAFLIREAVLDSYFDFLKEEYLKRDLEFSKYEYVQNHKGWKIVCLEPYHKDSHPVMVIIGRNK